MINKAPSQIFVVEEPLNNGEIRPRLSLYQSEITESVKTSVMDYAEVDNEPLECKIIK